MPEEARQEGAAETLPAVPRRELPDAIDEFHGSDAVIGDEDAADGPVPVELAAVVRHHPREGIPRRRGSHGELQLARPVLRMCCSVL